MSDWNPRPTDTARHTWRGSINALIIAAGVLVVVLVVTAVATGGFGLFSQKSANFRGETSKKNRVEGNGAYRIAAYDQFFNLCASVQTNETNIASLRQELNDKENPPDAYAKSQIATNITANRNQRNASINQYNVDARKSYTLAQFRDSKLPYQLDPNQETTTCTS
jgi:hypothetical protein